jgi:hypothetical protein
VCVNNLVLICVSYLQSYSSGATERLLIYVFVLSRGSYFTRQSSVHVSIQADGRREKNTPAQQGGGALRCVAVRCGAHGGTSLGNATVIQSWTVSASCSDESSAVQLTSHTTLYTKTLHEELVVINDVTTVIHHW